jgi:WbqC-like protein family
MIVAIHQPQFLPWLGYFHKILVADAFCLLDDVQFKKNEWQNRNRIKTVQGWQWLTVPVKYRFPEKIIEVRINDTVNWKKKHLASLRTNYRKAPYFGEYIGIIEEAYKIGFTHITDLSCHIIDELRKILNLQNKPVIRSSDLTGLSDDPTQRLIDICRYFNGNTYLSGADGPKYMDREKFKANGIQVVVQEFEHPVYPQCFSGFESHMSIMDLLFNCGPKSASIILGEKTA